MKNLITERQKQLLSIIYNFFAHSGYPPTYEEMRENLGVSSNQSITDLLEKLRKGGFIKKESGARSLAILPLGYQTIGRPPLAPVLGMTTAGLPAEAIATDIEWRPISSQLAEPNASVYLLRVVGDSMINAKIEDGDTVLVQERSEFVSGDIVLAYVKGEATIKRFISEDKPPYVFLKPENPKYPNILFTDDTELKGKVVSVLKNGSWKSAK